MSPRKESPCDFNFMPLQIVAKVPIAERKVNFSVTIGNWTCEDLVVTWKEDWSTDYGI